ncbi:MAG: ribosome silencing factor [Chloroflexi bacterium]|nr:ribosome silencing factor [Chloroflexota bacterium]
MIDSLEEKKGEDILLLDLRGIASFTDYFVICTGTSDRMLNALAEAVEEKVHQRYHLHGHLEGIASSGWLLLDYGDVIVHLFSPDQRRYYQLENLWSNGRVLLRLQ